MNSFIKIAICGIVCSALLGMNVPATLPQTAQWSFDLPNPTGTQGLEITNLKHNSNLLASQVDLPYVRVVYWDTGRLVTDQLGVGGFSTQNHYEQHDSAESTIQLQTQDNAKPGSYTVMVRVQAPEEQDSLVISRLYPIKLVLDVPQPSATTQTGESGNASSQLSMPFDVRDIVRASAIAAIVGLVGFIVYRRVKRKPTQSKD